tara:strand:- start:717 stop:2000 length:1284 start_codon:yes stop_codon:yes gene_type:complete
MENFNDDFVKKCAVNKIKDFTDKRPVFINGTKARLVLRVLPSGSKTFYLKFKERKVRLGYFDEENFNCAEAQFKAMKILKGEIEESDYSDCPTFRTMIHKVLEYKENVLMRRGTAQARSRLKQAPKWLLDTPIDRLNFQDTIKLRDQWLAKYKVGGFNNFVGECSSYWNLGNKYFYRHLIGEKANPFKDFKMVTIGKPRRKKPTRNDLIDIWKKIDDFMPSENWKVFFKLKMLLGCHNSELYRMKKDMIYKDDYGTWLYWGIGHHKNSSVLNRIEHRVWLHPKTVEMLDDYLEKNTESDWLFHGLNFADPMHPQSISSRWKRFKKESGCEWSADLFRHALISYMEAEDQNHEYITARCYTGGVDRQHYINFEDPKIINKFKVANEFYQDSLWKDVEECNEVSQMENCSPVHRWDNKPILTNTYKAIN